MITRMVMPEVSLTTAEVKLVSWLKQPGDPVRRGEPLIEVETDKATVEVEAFVDGFLRATKYPDGATVPVGSVIAILTTTPDEAIVDERPAPAPGAPSPDEAAAGLEPVRQTPVPTRGRLDVSPVARRLAEDSRLDLASLQGSGPGGRITRADVEAALQAGNSPTAEAQAGRRSADHTPAAYSMRSAIAQRTSLSKASIPHYYVSIEIDMQAVLAELDPGKVGTVSHQAERPTLTDVVVWACGQVLPDYPSLHGTWTDAGPRNLPEINIGLVVGLDEGLMVPVVHDVDRLSLPALASTTRALKQKARQGGLSTRELTGGTFTVSNLGMFGVTSFIAVINPPESAILALGATLKRAVVVADDQVVVRPVMTATLSVDHRMVDGIVAAGFLNALKERLEGFSSTAIDPA